MERSKNRIHNRNLRGRTEPCSREEFSHRERRHRHSMNTVEELIPQEDSHQRGRRHPMHTEECIPGRGFRHRARPSQHVSQPSRDIGEQNRYRFFMHPEPFTAPRDLMHEKWMLEMRIFRLKKRLHRINHRLRKQFE
ncbi:MAG: hypothetical protein Q7U53_13610 [Anaerolineaceae bacterium]|nr:hypothetical protein [Anaerolineaceae bacterium]